MTKSLLGLHDEVGYLSVAWRESAVTPGVRFAVRRPSLGQRIELAKRAKELALRHEVLKAGEAREQLEASLSELYVQRLYLEWGLAGLEGLTIDGERATAARLIERGPEELSNEILEAVVREARLSDDERKNF